VNGEARMDNIWQLTEAKNKFNELVNRAQAQGPQVVTRGGKKTVVVLSFEDYERLTKNSNSLTQILMKSPLVGSDLDILRDEESTKS
jgi:prevent-host-death family protein